MVDTYKEIQLAHFSITKKNVLTGQLLDNSQDPVVSTTEHPKTTSYACNRCSANGIKNTIQINLQDDTVYRQKVFRDHTFNI